MFSWKNWYTDEISAKVILFIDAKPKLPNFTEKLKTARVVISAVRRLP